MLKHFSKLTTTLQRRTRSLFANIPFRKKHNLSISNFILSSVELWRHLYIFAVPSSVCIVEAVLQTIFLNPLGKMILEIF